MKAYYSFPLAALLLFLIAGSFQTLASQSPSLSQKKEGMLMGSVIGDAAGGPLEFVVPPQRSKWTTMDRKITAAGLDSLGALFRLRPYPKEWEPFAQWESYGPAGTITDDTRFKLIFFNALEKHGPDLEQADFASAVLDFRKEIPSRYHEQYDIWIPEIAFATHWALGKRENAYPVERIWGGIPTMEGQMPFLPIAALNPGDPDWCYRKCYELGYFDIGVAKDINSALVAGLARALQEDGSWENFEEAMHNVDPYCYNETLYVSRELKRWLDVAHDMARRADGNLSMLFDILESELETTYWWEAWVPLVVVMAVAETAGYHPMACMQIILEFGHDTDSYAQVMGAVLGAIHGPEIFPEEMRRQANLIMKEQFGQNVEDWLELLDSIKTGQFP